MIQRSLYVLVLAAVALACVLNAQLYPVAAQPVPRHEQSTRLILALEKHNQALEANTRAIRELTQALQRQKSGF